MADKRKFKSAGWAWEMACSVLNHLANEYGSETFVSEGYGYYSDAEDLITEALVEAEARGMERAAKIAESWVGLENYSTAIRAAIKEES